MSNPTTFGSARRVVAGRGRNDPRPPYYGSRFRHTPLARLAFHREQAPDTGRDRAHHSALDPVAVLPHHPHLFTSLCSPI